MADSSRLDILQFPLYGSRLIEASAGTGKTWTIASLYLRLVLGHGHPASADAPGPPETPTAFHQALSPAEILVMTFTRAATRELSERIRERLAQAARYFRGEASPDFKDAVLVGLLADYPPGPRREAAAWRLATAAEAMDEGAVLTIDAWCQRMLNEHAFETGNPFDETLVADERTLLDEAARDYWRQHCYPLQGPALEHTISLWSDAEALRKDIKPILNQTLVGSGRYLLDGALGPLVEQVLADRAAQLKGLATGWVARAQSLRAWIDDQVTRQPKAWDRPKLRPKTLDGWFGQITQWAQAPDTAPKLKLTNSARQRLSASGIREAYLGDSNMLELPPALDELEALQRTLEEMQPAFAPLRMHAAHHIATRLAELKQRARSFSFADMTLRLERALSGPRGAALRTRMLRQYRVALIDEFQDTSPGQYRLFDAIYRCAANDPDHALILIGDPKQSIYGFRGADIYSYLRARSATAGRHYALDINYRSTRAMVATVNAWFGMAESRTDLEADGAGAGGAFRLRKPNTQPVPFIPAGVRGRDRAFHAAGQPVPAMVIEHTLTPLSNKEVLWRFSEACAEQIVGWLNADHTGFVAKDNDLIRLRPRDIAILVRNRFEAAAVRRSLRSRGVASVFLSDRASVFASDEALDLLRWLRAIASPGDVALARAALATPTIGLPLVDLARLASDEDAFDAYVERMRRLNATWAAQGVLAMLRQGLHSFDLPTRWLAQPEGERRLTNVLHLAELLQDASLTLQGEHALIRWLTERIDDSEDSEADEQILRLESDADLIQVITVHKSKGLQYPVVCIPFACTHTPIEQGKARFLSILDATGARAMTLDFGPTEIEEADLERQREDLRLFYVALTRAEYTVWMGFASIRIGRSGECRTRSSAPGYLLGGTDPRAGHEWLDVLETLSARATLELQSIRSLAEDSFAPDESTGPGSCISIRAAQDPPTQVTRLERTSTPPALAPTRPYSAHFERDWTLQSFTSMVRGVDRRDHATIDPRRPAEDEHWPFNGDSTEQSIDRNGLPPTLHYSSPPQPWHTLEGSSRFGSFIHDLLEWLASERFAWRESARLRDALIERCRLSRYADRTDCLIQWIDAVIDTRLPSLDARLPELSCTLTEMEFWIPVDRLDVSAVDRLCQRHLLAGRSRPALTPRALNGMLKGFADLVIEHAGRYWVMDYKTNLIRPQPSGDALAEPAPGRGSDYDRTAIEIVMAHHRYDVQAALYLFALHRQLRARLGNAYRAADQLGGGIYWFLRGIDGPMRGEYAMPMSEGLMDLLDGLDALIGPVFSQ